MPSLQTLRNARWLTRLVLVGFALFVGAATASALVKPPGSQMVCTTMGGMQLVSDVPDGQDHLPPVGMDCPLCAPLLVPPPPLATGLLHPGAEVGGFHRLPAGSITPSTRAPLPPRGPPGPG